MNHSHEPKLHALIAYAGGALSDEGRARLERHLGRCEICTGALIEVLAYDTAAEEVRAASPPPIDYQEMELALRREARAQATTLRAATLDPRSTPWLPIAVFAAAALLAIVAAWPLGGPDSAPERSARETEHETSPETPNSPPTAEAQLEATIVAVRGEARLDGRSATVGAPVSEGQRIELGEGELHVRLAGGTGFALEGTASALGLRRTRASGVVLALRDGRVASRVRTGTLYDVEAGPYTVRVRGTHFEVTRQAEDVAVRVDEGRVDIFRGEDRITRLSAPATWSSGGLEPSERVRLVHGVGEAMEASLGTLSLPALDGVERWEIGESAWQASGGLAMQLQQGRHQLVAVDPQGRRRSTILDLGSAGIALSERDLPPRRPVRRVGTLAPEAIQGVIQPRLRNLRRCYDRQLRRGNPALAGRFTLRVRVASSGEVERVRVSAEHEAPPPLLLCLRREASGWTFPEPEGGPATFDLPLDLTPAR